MRILYVRSILYVLYPRVVFVCTNYVVSSRQTYCTEKHVRTHKIHTRTHIIQLICHDDDVVVRSSCVVVAPVGVLLYDGSG